MANRGSISTGYDIDNSLKVESDNREYLRWTNFSTYASSARKKKFSMSLWCKRTELGSQQVIWSTAQNGYLSFEDDDEIKWFQTYSGVQKKLNTNRVFRDTSAWYNIIVAVDSTQATEANRMRLYVNGVEETSFVSATYPSQNDEAQNIYEQHLILGEWGGGATGFNGYIADYLFVSEVQLVPSDVGEVDEDSGIWKPKAYSGTISSPSQFLEFQDGSDLGTATSGLDADTMNNIAAADQATDTPTNNGCTLNVLASLEGSNDITEGALVSTGKAGGGGNFNGTYGTMGIDPFNSTVDWYWEIEASSTTNGSSDDIGIGWIKESRITSGSTIYSDVYGDGISRYSSQTATSAGDIWGVLLETGATPVMKLYRNDGLIHTSTHGSGGVSFDTLMFPYITVKGTGTDARLNFLNPASSFSIASGNTDPNGYGNFEFDPKSGYALCTKNLAEFG